MHATDIYSCAHVSFFVCLIIGVVLMFLTIFGTHFIKKLIIEFLKFKSSLKFQ